MMDTIDTSTAAVKIARAAVADAIRLMAENAALRAERDAALARVAELEGVRDRYRQFISDEVMAELGASASIAKEPTP
jgi:hypothetical protein